MIASTIHYLREIVWRLMGYNPEPFVEMTLRINDYLRQMFYILGIDLVDFKG